MKIFSVSMLILWLSLLTTGCTVTKLESNIAPGENFSNLETIYVETLPADERGIQKLLEDQLNSMGFTASSGSKANAPENVDAILTYEDKWMWDLTMYMIELRVQVKDPATDFERGSAFSYRTSLSRKSPEDMVAEVLNKLFEKSPKE